MEMLAILLAVITVILFVLYSCITSKRVQNPPPGPAGWPILGCFLQVEPWRLHVSLDGWGRKYGPLILVKMATKNVISISCPRLARKACVESGYSDVLNDRPDSFFSKYIMDDAKGVTFGKYRKDWICLRKTMFKGLNMFGDGVQRFETLTHNELGMLMKTVADSEGRDFDPLPLLSRSLANIISILITGSTQNEADSDLMWKYISCSKDILELSTDATLFAFPFLRFLPVEVGRKYRRMMEAKKKLLDKYYLSYKETFKPGQERGLVDILFQFQEQEIRNKEKELLTDSQIKAFLQDTIAGGLVTTTNGLVCILLVLLRHHECVDGIYKEITKVIGLDRFASLKDTHDMPYTESVILEAMRYISHVPLSVPHSAMEDVNIEGYTIPKQSTILINIWTIHHDPAIWDDPWTFKPGRFLDENGELLPPGHALRTAMVSYGLGKRSCVGENLAKSRIFLYLTTLIQKFDMLPPETDSLPSDDSRTFPPGGVLRPQNYKMRAIAR